MVVVLLLVLLMVVVVREIRTAKRWRVKLIVQRLMILSPSAKDPCLDVRVESACAHNGCGIQLRHDADDESHVSRACHFCVCVFCLQSQAPASEQRISP